MKKLLGVIVVLQAFVMTASAAPPPPPAPSWSGFYAGGNFGIGTGSVSSNYNVTFSGTDPSASGSQNISGPFGGVQAGYNWQRGIWVFGLETDFQVSGQNSYSAVTIDPIAGIVTDDHSVQLPWFGTARARVGFTPTNVWLFYATGGFAYGHIQESNTLTGAAVGSHSLTNGGWTVGGGAEMALGNNWTAKLEYLYIDLGDFNDTAISPAGFFTATISSHLTDNVVRVGLNYQFH